MAKKAVKNQQLAVRNETLGEAGISCEAVQQLEQQRFHDRAINSHRKQLRTTGAVNGSITRTSQGHVRS
jgi:hypothetical protein